MMKWKAPCHHFDVAGSRNRQTYLSLSPDYIVSNQSPVSCFLNSNVRARSRKLCCPLQVRFRLFVSPMLWLFTSTNLRSSQTKLLFRIGRRLRYARCIRTVSVVPISKVQVKLPFLDDPSVDQNP